MRRGRIYASLAGLSLLLLAFFLARYPVRGFRVPMGPDAPVYMWWANLARLDGLSVASWRPGTPALTLMLGGTLGRDQLEVVAGLGGALAAAVGLAAFAMVRRGTSLTMPWALLAGLLAGTWSVHLAGGYLGNLVFALAFMAAVALLVRAGNGGLVAASVLLGGGGLAHPMFMVLGVVVLLLGLWMCRDVAARARIWTAAAVGGAVTGAGLLAMLIGPRPLSADTSADAFMRRAGFGAELRGAYLDRFRHHWAKYAPWVSLPFAWVGRREADEPLRPILNAWVIVAFAGLVLSLLTQVIPGVRLLAFAFALPVLVAFGLSRISRSLTHGWIAWVIVVAVAGLMVAAAGLTWSRERPYAELIVLDRIETAAGRLAETPAGTPLVFVMDEPIPDDLLPFRMTNTGNLLRAYLPAERIDDIRTFVGSPDDLLAGRPSLDGGTFHDALSKQTLADLRGTDLDGARIFVLTGRVSSVDQPGVESLLTEDVYPNEVDLPSSWSLVLSGVLSFALLLLVGAGWARAAVSDGIDAIALAPAFGAAALILVGVIADRFGLRLAGATPWLTGTIGIAGYIVWAVGRTRPRDPGMRNSRA